MNVNEIMQNQPVLNIGCLGCVSDGKSTLVSKLTGTKTQKYKSEKQRNITIKLGYANCKIYKCVDCPDPDCYFSTDSSATNKNCELCDSECKLVHHVSFVDCPGHHDLILTLLSGLCVMDNNIVVVSGVDSISKKPKLIDHLWAVKHSNLPEPIFCLNKLDLIEKPVSVKRYNELVNVIDEQLNLDNPLIIPTSFNFGLNVKNVLSNICSKFKIPERDINVKPSFLITRTFDINKTGCDISDLKGGIVGGSLICGVLHKNDIIEIRPGFMTMENDKMVCKSICSKIVNIKSDKNNLEMAFPGGLIALELEIDPYFTKGDNFVGQRLGLKGQLPNCYSELECDLQVLDDRIFKSKNVVVTLNSSNTQGQIVKIGNNKITIKLSGTVLCIMENEKVIISLNENPIVILGVGTFINGLE